MATHVIGDLLAAAEWRCAATSPGLAGHPSDLKSGLDWLPLPGPATAAAALRAAGESLDGRDLDAEDWWFLASFDAADLSCRRQLRVDGLATVADVWLNDELVLHSENMFHSHIVEVPQLRESNVLAIRCSSLRSLFAIRRPRPRWKVSRLKYPSQRWFRTTMLGRLKGWVPIPAAVGPWRPMLLLPASPVDVVGKRIEACCDETTDGGRVEIDLELVGESASGPARVWVGEHSAPVTIHWQEEHGTASAIVELDVVERWWPHTHGEQPLYPVTLEIGEIRIDLGVVGFRTIDFDRTDDAFAAVINGVPAFLRGACWTPLDADMLANPRDRLRVALEAVKQANLNVLRLTGESVYPEELFYDLCDELGLLVWQDCMLAFADPPDDVDFADSLTVEVRQLAQRLTGHPCLAVLSGGNEIEQQAAAMGVHDEALPIPVLDELIPALLAQDLPHVTYLASTPTGGARALEPRVGVSHYYGVGGYLRPVEDIHQAGVRFAAECLAFAIPPEPSTVEQACGGAYRAGHEPAWKSAIHRDTTSSWDFEDVTEYYAERMFGVRLFEIRRTNPERYLDFCRAVAADLFDQVWSQWRSTGSSCAGAIVFQLRDWLPGAGLGLIDALDRPKSAWYVLRRVCAPQTVVVTDEGLNGLDAHVVNDSAGDLDCTVQIELFANNGLRTDVVRLPLHVPARGRRRLPLSAAFGGFRDLTYAYRFGPPTIDVVGVKLLNAEGFEIACTTHLPEGRVRPLASDIGLRAAATQLGEQWQVTVQSDSFGQWVALDVPGYQPDDSWFSLLPGEPRVVGLRAVGEDRPPRGTVRAFNSERNCRITVA